MKYRIPERTEIGQIAEKAEWTHFESAERKGIDGMTARGCMRIYCG